MLSHLVDAVAIAVLVLGGAVWVGGYVTIVVVNRVAAQTLPTPQRVDFFRALGRRFGATSTIALLLAFAGGATLARGRSWDATLATTLALAVALVVATAIGVRQARSMTALRRHALAQPQGSSAASSLKRAARQAAALRGLIGVLTAALLTCAVLLVA